jgi:histidine ammonia-lyase
VQLSANAQQRVKRARNMLDEIVQENKAVYGVTTGFGNFANVRIENDKLM